MLFQLYLIIYECSGSQDDLNNISDPNTISVINSAQTTPTDGAVSKNELIEENETRKSTGEVQDKDKPHDEFSSLGKENDCHSISIPEEMLKELEFFNAKYLSIGDTNVSFLIEKIKKFETFLPSNEHSKKYEIELEKIKEEYSSKEIYKKTEQIFMRLEGIKVIIFEDVVILKIYADFFNEFEEILPFQENYIYAYSKTPGEYKNLLRKLKKIFESNFKKLTKLVSKLDTFSEKLKSFDPKNHNWRTNGIISIDNPDNLNKVDNYEPFRRILYKFNNIPDFKFILNEKYHSDHKRFNDLESEFKGFECEKDSCIVKKNIKEFEKLVSKMNVKFIICEKEIEDLPYVQRCNSYNLNWKEYVKKEESSLQEIDNQFKNLSKLEKKIKKMIEEKVCHSSHSIFRIFSIN